MAKTRSPKPAQPGASSPQQQQGQNFDNRHETAERGTKPQSGDSPKPHGDHFSNVIKDQPSK